MKNLTRPLEMIWATIPAGSFIMGSSKKQVDQIKQLDPGYSDEWLNRKNHHEREDQLAHDEMEVMEDDDE